MVQFDHRYFAKYPFLPAAQSFIRDTTTSFNTYIESNPGRLAVKEAYETISCAIRFNSREPPEKLPEVPKEAEAVKIIISAYPISRILVSCLGDRMVIDRFCRYQAWKVYRYLQDEEPEIKEFIASKLGLAENSTGMPVIQYVEIASRLTGERWRLVNRVVDHGVVCIYPDEIDEILRERVRVIINEKLPQKVPSSLCVSLEPVLDRIKTTIQERMLEEFGSVEESAFPPCMQAIINALIQRTQLTHMGRFAVTAFLHNIGMENTRIIEIYGNVPNFDLSKTMYQVDHISGQGGSGTEYTSPLCSTMRTHSLCIHPDALCSKITHPLSYYKQKKRMIESAKKKGIEESPRSGNIPDKVSAPADNSNEDKQGGKVRNPSGHNDRDNQESNKEHNQT